MRKNNEYLGHDFRNKPKYCQLWNQNILHVINVDGEVESDTDEGVELVV